MSALIQTVATGDIIIFDKESRDLYVVDSEHADRWQAEKDQSVETAREYVKGGAAQHFDRKALGKIQAALAGVVLLV